MRDTEDIRSKLSAYLDGELPEAEYEIVRRALEADPGMAEQLDQLRQTRDLVRKLPRLRAPDDFATSLLTKAERRTLLASPQSEKRPRHWGWKGLTAVAAALVLAGGLGLAISFALDDDPAAEGLAVTDPTGQVSGEATAPQPNESQSRLPRGQDANGETPPSDVQDEQDQFDWMEGNAVDVAQLAAPRAPEPETNVVLYTDELAETNTAVQRVLLSSGVPPALGTEEVVVSASSKEGRPVRGNNFYWERSNTARQVQIEVRTTPRQMRAIEAKIANLFAGQELADNQSPPPPRGQTMRQWDAAPVRPSPQGRQAASKPASGVAIAADPGGLQRRSEEQELGRIIRRSIDALEGWMATTQGAPPDDGGSAPAGEQPEGRARALRADHPRDASLATSRSTGDPEAHPDCEGLLITVRLRPAPGAAEADDLEESASQPAK
ncbi:MAG: zf-HC2 domain-containing protein [Planctomycetota bacterium]